jgi:CheY-like chemotaxis protein
MSETLSQVLVWTLIGFLVLPWLFILVAPLFMVSSGMLAMPVLALGRIIAARKPRSALIVDDDYVFGHLLTKLLEKKGIAATYVGNPQLVPDMVNEKQPDLILLDQHMPTWSGKQTLAAISQSVRDRKKHLNHKMKILIVSAFPTEEWSQDSWDGIEVVAAFSKENLKNIVGFASERPEQRRIYA